MVFIRRIKIKGKEYYVLEHTVRKGDRFVKKTKYIGKKLPPDRKLMQLKEGFLRKIAKGRYKYLSPEDVNRIERKKLQNKSRIRNLSKLERKKSLDEFIIRFTYDSNKLAGVNITLRQTYLILKEGIIPKNIKNLKTIKELENHKKGIIAITKYKGILNLRFIKKIHLILLSGINDEIAGKLRSELKRDVKLAGTSYIPPKWKEFEKELNNFFRWYKSESRKLHALELAALVHLKLISMQPFMDGNSRLSRLLMNWILWKKNYPLIDIPAEDLEEYYNALDKYQIEKKEKPFVDYIKSKYFES